MQSVLYQRWSCPLRMVKLTSTTVLVLWLWGGTLCGISHRCDAFSVFTRTRNRNGPKRTVTTRRRRSFGLPYSTDSRLYSDKNHNNNDNKFGFGQRVASVQCAVLGALTGSLAVAPVVALHDLIFGSGVAQWEFDTDTAAVEGALFAIVYRYCVREDDNAQLAQGVVGAFALVRTLSRIVVPSYCTALPLRCGPPLGYLDWNVLGELAGNGAESAILFGAVAAAMEWATNRKYIAKFPG